jgi:transcriptional regulator with XRE-family HTH domain
MSNLRLQIGKAVRRLRTAAGYSQEGFADACKLHRTYIGAIERGEKNLTTDTIERIARTLRIGPFDLFREAERDIPIGR